MKPFFTSIALLITGFFFAQQLGNIQSGEVLSYRIHYGIFTAGNATLTATKTTYNNLPHLYVKGTGRSSGAVRAFFKVDDLYESYINYNTGLPSFYVRNVSEGSYKQHYETAFNHENQTLILTDKKNPKNGSKLIKSVKGVQDMLSAFYYLRSMDASQLKVGAVKDINIWIDDELFPFRLKVADTETIKTKFGKVNCLKIIPSVMSGRVFKDKEGVTLWVTNDANHIPVSIKAELAVGSLKADLDGYQNVKFPIAFKK
ncbi:MAG: DUF3108 domain-containing protein [Flavobacteriaceae bacterium]|jgi:hypothetical protein|nr:DUF3108 domain-containing protein [Flavobacteriaceae bacterium]